MDSLIKIFNLLAIIATPVTIIIAVFQLRQNQKLAILEFENQIETNYRDIIKDIPYNVFLNKEIEEKDLNNVKVSLYRYFDFSNSEVLMRKNGKISKETWNNWNEGIKENMERKIFKETFSQISQDSSEIFKSLNRLINTNFKEDPYVHKMYKRKKIIGS